MALMRFQREHKQTQRLEPSRRATPRAATVPEPASVRLHSGQWRALIVVWLLAAATILVASSRAATLPIITAQPQGRTVTVGGSATFTVAATGDGPLTFEWWNESGPLYPPQTGTTLSLASIQPGDSGSYKVHVRNAAGTVTSAAAALAVNSSQTDNFLVARKAAGTGADPGGSVDIDSAGNVFVVGSFAGSASFGTFTLTSAGGSDVFVVKYDRGGNVAWAKRAGGAGADIGAGVAVDRMGNVHITGSFSGSADFGGVPLVASSASDAFVATFDKDGHALWARKAGGVGTTKGWRVACDAAGNSIVLGNFSGSTAVGATTLNSSGGDDAFLAKFSSSGVPLWAKRFGGTGADKGTGLALDPDGSVFATGSFQGTANFGGFGLNGGGTQSFLVKCDRAGLALWARNVSGIDSATGTTVIAEDDGTCNLTGTYSGTATFGGSVTLANRVAGERFVARYDAAGNVEWAARSDAAGSQVGLQPSDAAVTSGFGSGALDWTGGAGGSTDLLVARFSEPGVAAWAKQAGGSLTAFTLGLLSDAEGRRYVTGFFEDEDGVLAGGGYSLARIPLAAAAGPLPPLITLMPQSQSVFPGGSASLSVTASGASALSYQWRFNGTDIPGANGATLALNNVQIGQAGNYSVVVFNADGSALSHAAQVTIQVPADTTAPTITIISPAAEARFTNAVVTLQGTAADNSALERVEVQVGSGGVQFANGTANWSASVTLAVGTNTVRARSVDTTGNVSGWASRALVYAPVTITNSTPTNPPASSTNALVLAKAGYSGLFYEAGAFRHESSGFFSLATAPGGRFSAVLIPGGRRFSISGRLSPDGRMTNHIVRSGTNVLTVMLELTSSNGVDQVSGSVIGTRWIAELWGGRSASGSATNPVPWAGRYTLVVPGAESGPSPFGDGFGAAAVDARGRLSVSATLGDGTKVTQAVPLTRGGLWPFYGRLYGGKGSAAGWVAFAGPPEDDFSGDFGWICPTQPKRRLFPAGFAERAMIIGSRYVRPAGRTNRVVQIETGAVEFSGGNLFAPFANDVFLNSNNRAVNLGSNKLTLSISLPNGLFSGRVVDPGSRKPISFRGALLQNRNGGWGHFKGTNQTGRVTLRP